jgi:hypothetical protein
MVKQSTYKRWGNDHGRKDGAQACEYAIRIPGNQQAYEIGVVRDGEGYKLLWDSFMGGYGLEKVVGENADILKDAYAAALSTSHYSQLGYMVTQEMTEDGAIVLTATR